MPPHAAALIAVCVLGAVVWIGLSGRASSPDAPRTIAGPSASAIPSGSGAVQTATAGQSSATPARVPPRTPPPEPVYERKPRAIPFARDKYAADAYIDSRHFRTLMAEIEPGRFIGSFRVPFPADSTTRYQITLAQLWSRDSRRGGFVEIGTWPLYLVPLQAGTQASGPVLQAGMAAQRQLGRVPRAVQLGFSMTVRAESLVTHGMVRIEIQFGSRRGR